MKPESSPEDEIDEVVFLLSKYCNKKPTNLTESKHKGVQSHITYTLEEAKFYLENK